MKRLMAFLFILCFLINMIAYASEAPMTYTAEEKIEKLKEYDVIHGYEDGKFYPQNNITRAEFCKIVSAISGFQANSAIDNYNYFADVPSDHWANKYIMFCYNNGFVNGVSQSEKLYFVDLDENGNEVGRSELFYKDNIGELYGTEAKIPENLFAPDNYITYQEALKILVCVLGYEDLAKKRGDYPYGYVSVAREIGIIESDFSYNECMSRESAAEAVYNTLFIPMMIKENISDENGDRTEFVISDGNKGTELQTLYKRYFEKCE